MQVLAHVAHRFASQVRVNGVLCLSSNGDPVLVRVFAELGWSDPQPIDSIPEPVKAQPPIERAVLDPPVRRRG